VDPRELQTLLTAARSATESGNSALVKLHESGDRGAFDAARDLLESPDPEDRLFAAQILRELGRPEYPFARETVSLLASAGQHETDADVLEWFASALTYQGRDEALPLLLQWAAIGPAGGPRCHHAQPHQHVYGRASG